MKPGEQFELSREEYVFNEPRDVQLILVKVNRDLETAVQKLEEYKIYLSNLLNCKCNITIKEHPNDGFEVTFKKNILYGFRKRI